MTLLRVESRALSTPNPDIPDMRPDISTEAVNAPQQAMFRGYSDVPGYYDQEEFPEIEQQPIPAGLGQPEGVESPSQEQFTVSMNDISRMNPKEAAAAITNQIGERPTSADVKASLKKEAMVMFRDHYIANEHREPSAQAWATFDEQFEKDQRVGTEVKAKQAEYDNQYTKLEKQASDMRAQKKVVDTRVGDGLKAGRELLNLIADPEKKKAATIAFHKEMAASGGDPIKIDDAVGGIPSVAKTEQRTPLQKEYDRFKTNNPSYTGNLIQFYQDKSKKSLRERAVAMAQKDNRLLFGGEQGRTLEQLTEEYMKELSETPEEVQPNNTFSHTATDANGNKIGWDGKQWISIQ